MKTGNVKVAPKALPAGKAGAVRQGYGGKYRRAAPPRAQATAGPWK